MATFTYSTHATAQTATVNGVTVYGTGPGEVMAALNDDRSGGGASGFITLAAGWDSVRQVPMTMVTVATSAITTVT